MRQLLEFSNAGVTQIYKHHQNQKNTISHCTNLVNGQTKDVNQREFQTQKLLSNVRSKATVQTGLVEDEEEGFEPTCIT